MNIRSLLIGFTFAATLLGLASPSARAQGLLADLGTTAVFDACPRLLGQAPPVARRDPSPEARALVEFFAQSPRASDYSTDAAGGRLHVSRVPTSPTEFGCLVRISGPSRDSAIAAVTQFAGSAGSGWSKPEARRYFNRLLLVSIYDAGTHLLMIPSQGTSERDGIVISKIDLGGRDALQPAPDNTAPLMRAALEVCAHGVAAIFPPKQDPVFSRVIRGSVFPKPQPHSAVVSSRRKRLTRRMPVNSSARH